MPVPAGRSAEAVVDFRRDRAPPAAGLYVLPSGRVWMRPQARIALGADGGGTLRIAFHAPQGLFGLANLERAASHRGPPRLALRIAGCDGMVHEIPRPGPQVLQMPLRCAGGPPSGNVVLALELDRAVLQHVFVADGRSLGLELHSIAIAAS